MGYIVRMPQMGMEMDEGEVVEWTHGEGDAVSEGEVVAVVESEKATNDVEAREDGVVREVVVAEGESVEPGTPIGIVADPDEDVADLRAEIEDSEAVAATAEAGDGTGAAAPSGTASGGASSAGGPPSAGATGGSSASEGATDDATVRATPGAEEAAADLDVDLAAVEGTGPQGVVTEDDVRNHADGVATDGETTDAGGPNGTESADVRATPGARRAAESAGVDLSAVEGTGPQGVVTEDDVEAHAEQAGGGAAGAATRTVREARELSGMQETVSERLGESYRNAVHVTVNRSFAARTLVDVADAADVSVTDLLVRAVGGQLASHPEFNAVFEDGEHRLVEEVNVGVAVDVEDGLVTPVVPAVTEKSVEEVASVRADRTERARSGSFTAADLSGGTFTVSNLGMFGVDHFDPVINPPEVAILGVGRVRDDGTMTLSLSFDHRVVNGADAARFLDGLVGDLTDLGTLASFFDDGPF